MQRQQHQIIWIKQQNSKPERLSKIKKNDGFQSLLTTGTNVIFIQPCKFQIFSCFNVHIKNGQQQQFPIWNEKLDFNAWIWSNAFMIGFDSYAKFIWRKRMIFQVFLTFSPYGITFDHHCNYMSNVPLCFKLLKDNL